MVGRYILWICIIFGACEGFAAEYTLADFYRLALERSEKVKISAEDLYIAERTKDKALAVLVPKLVGVGGYTSYRDSEVSDTGSLTQPKYGTSFTIRADQSMSLSGREITAFRVARDGIEKSRQDLAAVKEAYLLTVSNAYYDHLRALRHYQVSQADVTRLTKHRDAAASRLKVGEVTKTALLRAEAELSGAQSDLVKAENGVKFTRAVLARVVGLDEEFTIKEKIDPLPRFQDGTLRETLDRELADVVEGCMPMTVDCLRDVGFRERWELKSLYVQKRIAEGQVKYTRGAYWPTLTAEGSYSSKHENPETGGLVRDSLYGGLRLTIPVFEGGLRVAEVKEALAKERQVDYAIVDQKKTIAVETESAYLDFMTQKGIFKSTEDELVFSRDNYNAVSRQFDFGLANSVDVMDANTLLVRAQRQLIDAVYNYQLAALRVKRATGTLLRWAGLEESGPGSNAGKGR